jgi:hypothetical protein
MPPGLQFGVEQLAVDGHLKAAVVRRDQDEGFDLGFVRSQQFGCQTGSTVGVVSNRTVFDGDFEQHRMASDQDVG